MSDDYATLALIEDHLRRIADALERAHPKFNPGGYVPEMPSCSYGRVATREEIRALWEACDDRTCTDRDHWAPMARINHGSTPTTCVHGQDHPDTLTCDYPCAATMPGHWCTRREHADDRHVWAMSDEEAQRILRSGQELGFVDDNHQPRHDRNGSHWTWRDGAGWRIRSSIGSPIPISLAFVSAAYGPLTFCDCDDAATIEAENGATD